MKRQFLSGLHHFFFSFVKPDNLSVYPSKISLQRKKQDQKCELLKIWDLVQNSKPQTDSTGRMVTPKFCLGPYSSLPLTKATYGYKAPLIASTLRKPQYYWLISGRTDTLHVPSSYTPSLQPCCLLAEPKQWAWWTFLWTFLGSPLVCQALCCCNDPRFSSCCLQTWCLLS